MFLSFVEPSLVRPHLDCRVVAAADVIELLEFRAIPAGVPVFLDEHTMRPIEPVCSWFRHLAYEDKDAKTLREYAYIVRRFAQFLDSRGRGLLTATESDFSAYRALRTQLQDRPVGVATWGKEAQLLNQLYRWPANGLPPHPMSWHDNDLRRLIRVLREQLSGSIRHYIATFKMLHQYGPALTCRGLRSDPWSGTSARTVAATSAVAVVSTPVIPPEQWFPLIRAARTYVHTFAPDILRAQQRYQNLLAQATAMTPDRDTRLDRWLADPRQSHPRPRRPTRPR